MTHSGAQAMIKPTENDPNWVHNLRHIVSEAERNGYPNAGGILAQFNKFYALSAALAVEAGAEPRAWFVKDYADGWYHFDNEVDAQAYRAMSGSALLVAYSPDALTTSPASSAVEGEAVAWRHTMYYETGEKGDTRITESACSPFGIPGHDYDETFTVTCEPLYAHPAPTPAGEWRDQIEWLKSRLADLQLPSGKRDHDTREKWLMECGMPASPAPQTEDRG